MKKTLFFTLLLLPSFLLAQNRLQTTFNTAWKFQKGETALAEHPFFDDRSWEVINLPHSWNTTDVTDEADGYYRGIGWYRKTFRLSENYRNKAIFVRFEGANQVAEVFVNGHFAGRHTGGYTAFCFDITKYIHHDKENYLAVKLNNSHDKNIPPLSADFTFYGGIYRDVHLIATEKIHFTLTEDASQGLYIQTPEVSGKKARITFRGSIKNHTDKNREIKIAHSIFDDQHQLVLKTENRLSAKAKAHTSFEHKAAELKNPALWSPENPYLYHVVSEIVDAKTGIVLDEISNPLGLRYFGFDPKKGFLLNGKPTQLIGANRHQDYPTLGNALPDDLHRRDMKLLKNMGANFVRVAHYPQDPAVLQACDELGLIASVEIPIVNYITETPEFYENCKTMQREMIRQNYNHPSVLIWCYMNEVLLKRPFRDKSYKDGFSPREKKYFENLRNLAQAIDELTRKQDPYRLSMIPNHMNFDLYHQVGLIDIPQVVGWNIYFGWYGADMSRLDQTLDEVYAKHYPNKPMIISEYGAGADPRIRAATPERFDFSVEWASKYHQYYLNAIRQRPHLMGGAIWNLVDFNSEGRKDAVPHINSKGITTLDRQPKDAYYFYQASLSAKPMVRIAPAGVKTRGGVQDSPEKLTCTQAVWVYSNAREVELFLNGKSQGKKTIENAQAHWQVPFVQGKNQLKAQAQIAGQLTKDFVEIDFQLQPYHLNSNEVPFSEINVNLGAHYHFTDNFGCLWLPDRAYRKGGFGYTDGQVHKIWNGFRTGDDKEIWETNNDPLFQTQLTNLSAYRFDVPDGEYELTLYFAELLSDKEREKLLYNLGAESDEKKATEREFDVSVNGKLLLKNLNLARQFGDHRAVKKRFTLRVKNNQGLEIQLKANKGSAVLNAIKLRKLY